MSSAPTIAFVSASSDPAPAARKSCRTPSPAPIRNSWAWPISTRAGKRTVQIGHQGCSSGQVTDATAFLNTGYLGKITAIHAHMYRNTPHGKPQWSRPVFPDMTPENIIWKSFLGGAPAHEFDANR